MSSIENFQRPYSLGIPNLDATHQEFVDLVNRLSDCDDESFAGLFPKLLEHMEEHFADEAKLMAESDFPAIAEHMAEHDRVLGEMANLSDGPQEERTGMARTYVSEQLPRWFKLHLMTMDNALAAHLCEVTDKTKGQQSAGRNAR